jgi:chromosome segregation ATPase
MIDVNALSTLVAILMSIGALYLAWRKAPHESRNLQAETDKTITDAALQLLEPMQRRIDELEKGRERDKARMAEHERRITELECELRNEKSEKAEVIDGAKRLYHQIESLNSKPVYRPPGIPGTGDLKAKP